MNYAFENIRISFLLRQLKINSFEYYEKPTGRQKIYKIISCANLNYLMYKAVENNWTCSVFSVSSRLKINILAV